MLDIIDHRRDSLGLKYVYAVNSRRAGGLSIGINLNTTNACNWRCIYCQVEGLRRGSAPAVQLGVLETELHSVIKDILDGDFFSRHHVPVESRVIRDIAVSGNGEPTTCREFDQVIGCIDRVIRKFALTGTIKVVLITNGSLVHRPVVQKGIRQLAKMKGEIWFKLDSVTQNGIRTINNTNMTVTKIRKNLETAARLCPTWIQTCVFALDGNPPAAEEQQAYIQFISSLLGSGTPLKGILLYGLARPSYQPEAYRLSPLSLPWLEDYAARIRMTGIKVQLNA